MFLILSSAYIEQELGAELGKIPPAFLPLGNQRLFSHQLALVPAGETSYLTLPADYAVFPPDLASLTAEGVHLLSIPANLSLGEAVVASLSQVNESEGTGLHLLLGDALLRSLPAGEDLAATSVTEASQATTTRPQVAWKDCQPDQALLCGYFHFSQPKALLRCLKQSKGDFMQGIEAYRTQVGLAAQQAGKWYDLGGANAYYRSRAEFTTQRDFNKLTITQQYVEKSSKGSDKIRAEANWFTSLPPSIRTYVPRYLGDNGQAGQGFRYRLEYLQYLTLAELYVFSELPAHLWRKILPRCFSFLDECERLAAQPSAVTQSLTHLLEEKTAQRLAEFCQQMQLPSSKQWHFNGELSLSLDELLAQAKANSPQAAKASTFMHGDFCFSNILYDFNTEAIKTIDPRGMTAAGEVTVYGDIRYDLAKLSHSVLGMYDWIVAGYHHTTVDFDTGQIMHQVTQGSRCQAIQEMFTEMVADRYGISPRQLYAMQIHLFVSLLPLHSDDSYRQQGLFANAFWLFQAMEAC